MTEARDTLWNRVGYHMHIAQRVSNAWEEAMRLPLASPVLMDAIGGLLLAWAWPLSWPQTINRQNTITNGMHITHISDMLNIYIYICIVEYSQHVYTYIYIYICIVEYSKHVYIYIYIYIYIFNTYMFFQ